MGFGWVGRLLEIIETYWSIVEGMGVTIKTMPVCTTDHLRCRHRTAWYPTLILSHYLSSVAQFCTLSHFLTPFSGYLTIHVVG